MNRILLKNYHYRVVEFDDCIGCVYLLLYNFDLKKLSEITNQFYTKLIDNFCDVFLCIKINSNIVVLMNENKSLNGVRQ